ncbi:hypothetical protein P7L91_03130 [Bisgaard Taxon 10/6]|uniref:hypothetical protein n=1 Tax=Exercitatus varius TaxID=67857 RepID=UPI00294B4467|nr:hypothetical protein [Exercitatus varius]MDG2959834.1 hypothetical protein [Exercitatus varius]
MILYRGVSFHMDKLNDGKLVPTGTQPSTTLFHDEYFKYDGTGTYGKTDDNAVRAHQIKSGLYNGCYISTTSDYEIAKIFATQNYSINGYIYHLNTELFEQYGILMYQYTNPKYPKEQEITIRTIDCKEIPQAVIVKKEIIVIE